jgi:predicted DNA-binding transcriptional regulator AlpA
MSQPVVDKERVITMREACELLGVTEKTHWIQVVHEVTRDAPPWVAIRLQAIRRGVKEEP